MGFVEFLVRLYYAREESRRADKRNPRAVIPERILKLPEDDPERQRFLSGWKEEEISWLSPDYTGEMPLDFTQAVIFLRRLLITTAVLLVVGLGGLHYYNGYMQEVQEVRHEIRFTLHDKGYDMEDPFIRKQFGKLDEDYYLARLKGLLWYAQGMRTNLARLPTTHNPATGSYLAFIEANDLAFQPTQAIMWNANLYR